MDWLENLYIDVPGIRRGSIGAYGIAFVFTAVALLLRMAVDPYIEGAPYATFFLAVTSTALISGYRAGLFCVGLSAVSAWFFILSPKWSFRFESWGAVWALVLFIAVALAIVTLIGALRLAIERYRDLNKTLEQRVEERSQQLLNLQQQLAKTQRMEALGKLTAGVAHDFNNMNAIVLGNLDLIRRRLMKGDTDVVQFLDNATDGIQRATQLTQRLLSFARGQHLSPTTVDINKLTDGLSEMLRRTLGEHIAFNCIQAVGIWKAYVDPGQLENAIINLAVNARDAMPEGGKLTIETANAFLDEDYAGRNHEVTPGEYGVVAVSDTGSGMSAEVAARAIEPFFTTKEAGKGTGLGLSQVYGFVKQSGGHLAIYSEEGQGTTVRIYLPRANRRQKKEKNAGARGGVPLAGSKDIILVVEDDEALRQVSVNALRDLGYEVLQAANGAEALQALRDRPDITLLFTDVVLPGMNGPKLADLAKAQWPHLRVLYTTGFTRDAIIHDGTLDPNVALIVKPFTVDQLVRKISQ